LLFSFKDFEFKDAWSTSAAPPKISDRSMQRSTDTTRILARQEAVAGKSTEQAHAISDKIRRFWHCIFFHKALQKNKLPNLALRILSQTEAQWRRGGVVQRSCTGSRKRPLAWESGPPLRQISGRHSGKYLEPPPLPF
jgi:hypothetical protein